MCNCAKVSGMSPGEVEGHLNPLQASSHHDSAELLRPSLAHDGRG